MRSLRAGCGKLGGNATPAPGKSRMNKLHLASVAVWLAAAAVTAQPPSDVYSHPLPPPPEVLDRLNLRTAWRTYVPTDARRDGLFSVQVLDTQVIVLTRSGLVVALDRETGQTQ